ncbi:ATP-binding cassette domain-containing protein [Deinococcus sp. HMF7604]|uniref:energy-coupling factor ABC transporter ATP-binding protein n=1 Tax=Deinococcus betulae TaxID=2873312 RepID=UPI001CCB8C84|nr:ATP-binding cassette domain-containing protein [Deinococcus betulae]MBZ9749844.1 ATP-binding cassette domain-containing protein [Deinococcus betulae]
MSAPLLSTHDLSYTYRDGTQALRGVSLDFGLGAVTALIGANGAGKSTLFLNLLGLLKPSGGQVRFQGQPLGYKKSALDAYRQRVTLVVQDPDRQIFYARVADDVAFALRNLGLPDAEIQERVEGALRATGTEALRHKAVHSLSYGQKKRVALAGALALRPDVLLLDEPTAGLDPAMTEDMIDLLGRLRDGGTRLIVSSHDIDFIYAVSDHVFLLGRGEVQASGAPAEVFRDAALLRGCHLRQPWLVALHSQTGLPLFPTPEALFAHLKGGRL